MTKQKEDKVNAGKTMISRRTRIAATITFLVVPFGLAVAADATTDYDRNKNPRPEKSWHSVDAGEAPTTVNIGRLGSENGTSNYKVAPNGAVVPEVFDRIKNTEGYIEMQARTEQQDKTFTEYEDRVGTLEGLDRHWNYDPSLDTASAWVTTNDPRITDWTPAIHRQLSGFQQSATFRVSQKRPVEEYEKNYVNGDERLTNIRTEQRTFNETRTRWIDVAIGSWSNTGGLHSCTTWSPATNTVDQGTSFTQTQTCKQNQQRNVSYTVASTGENPGGAWTDTKTIDVNRTQSATGTKEELPDHWVKRCLPGHIKHSTKSRWIMTPDYSWPSGYHLIENDRLVLQHFEVPTPRNPIVYKGRKYYAGEIPRKTRMHVACEIP